MIFTKVFYRNRAVENERLELMDKDSRYSLGPDLTVKNCHLVLKVSARNLFIHERTRFVDCTFEVKQELKNHQQWVYASLERCRFTGRLSGCDFGHWPGYAKEAEQGSIQDCDFTEARLAGCRFMGCDPATLRLPRWPCFTILDPIGRAAELRSGQWPALFGRAIIGDLHTHPAPTRALTHFAPAVARQMETTPEELRAVIEQFDCIVY